MEPMHGRRVTVKIVVAIMGFAVGLTAMALPCSADTYWNVGVSGGRSGINGFNLSIGEYYGVPEREVVVVHERGIYEEELPVVFYLAQRAHVYPGYIVDLRLRGMSWMDITLYLGLSPDIYYVPVVIERYGPYYGPAYGYYRHHPRGGWTRHDLRDRDIVNQVNLRFMSQHHRYAPEKIMRYRSEGRSFHDIDRSIRGGGQEKTFSRRKSNSNQHDFRQNPQVRNMTKQNPPTRSMTRTEQNRQTINQWSQPTRSMAGPDVWRQNSFRQNQQVKNMTRQSQQVHKVNTPDEGQVNLYQQQPRQPRQMTRQNF